MARPISKVPSDEGHVRNGTIWIFGTKEIAVPLSSNNWNHGYVDTDEKEDEQYHAEIETGKLGYPIADFDSLYRFDVVHDH